MTDQQTREELRQQMTDPSRIYTRDELQSHLSGSDTWRDDRRFELTRQERFEVISRIAQQGQDVELMTLQGERVIVRAVNREPMNVSDWQFTITPS